MKLSSRTEYALLALVFIARAEGNGFVKADNIAAAQGIPLKFLEQILLALKNALLLKSMKGREGGYKLARDPKKVSIAEVVRLFDGAVAPTVSVSRYFYESTPIEKEKKLVRFFRGIRDEIARKVEKATIADML